mmetsp:Transcript_33817/g.41675  ORF Transcript_33817/g.41675 Transcript_33817/m.41675 type:complete len:273 (-) Transcript_33817:1120-1938(-)
MNISTRCLALCRKLFRGENSICVLDQNFLVLTHAKFQTYKLTTLTTASRASVKGSMESVKPLSEPLKGVIFDMDGTMTVPVLDFAEMRRRVGVESGDILQVIATWPKENQQVAHSVIAEMEQEALQKLELMPFLEELCSFLDSNNIQRALLTRNAQSSIEYFHQSFPLQAFAPAIGREFEPPKPHPAAILHICENWNIDPKDCVVVGDSAKHDILAGRNAGAKTILLDTENKYDLRKLHENHVPHFYATSLQEVHDIFTLHFRLISSNNLSQ